MAPHGKPAADPPTTVVRHFTPDEVRRLVEAAVGLHNQMPLSGSPRRRTTMPQASGGRHAGLSVSAYLRAAGLHHPIRSVLDHQAVCDLAKVNGDQGQLGGLLKL